MLPQILLFGSYLCLLPLSVVKGESTRLLTSAFRANTSLVQVGTPFTVTCLLADFSPGNSPYTVVFHRNVPTFTGETIIAAYEFPPVASPTTERHPNVTLFADQLPDISLTPFSANSTAVSLSILPKTVHPYLYSCKYRSNSSLIFASNDIPITVVETLPQVSFLTDIFQSSPFQLNQPYVFMCEISFFNYTADRLDSTYVTFYSKRHGLLLRYEYTDGHLLAYIRKHTNLTIHRGHFDAIYQVESGFPIFYLTLTVSSDLNQEFWCSLEAPDFPTFESNHWKALSFANFVSAKTDPTSRLGACNLDAFQPADEEYAVKFQSDHGPEKVNLLGTYTVKPNQTIEFDAEEVPGWTEIIYAAVPRFPTFAITARGNALNGSWWCTLAVGRKGTAGYAEFTSSKLDLA